MRSVPGLLSVFLIAAGVACAELPPDLPPASPLPFAPGPVIGGTIKGNPAAGIVPVKDLIEANRKDEYIPMADPIPGETGSSAPLAESIPNAEPIPGETNLHAPVQPAEASLAIPSTAFSPVPVPQHETRVAILGYHDFSRTLPATEMRMNTDVFRSQKEQRKKCGEKSFQHTCQIRSVIFKDKEIYCSLRHWRKHPWAGREITGGRIRHVAADKFGMAER